MRVRRIVNTVFTSNTYVLSEGGEAVIVDIGDIEPLERYLSRHRLTPRALLITHTHYDHIYGIRAFMVLYPDVPVYTSAFGKEAFGKPAWNFSRYHDDPISVTDERIKVTEEGELDLFGAVRAKVIPTPGHDKSCLSYLVISPEEPQGVLFSGDSYIPGIKTVATFPKSDKADAVASEALLVGLSEHRMLCPGHGPRCFPT